MQSGLWHIAALYHFAAILDAAAKQAELQTLCRQHGILGTILLAEEGINGTIAAPNRDGLAAVIGHISAWPEIAGEISHVKYAEHTEPGFLRLKIRLKNEIVTMRRPHITAENRGEYVEPEDWNELIERDDVMVIDTRNGYETRIGGFTGAVAPGTDSFAGFPRWADNLAKDTAPKKIAPRKIAMYCTGGIRCEKASAYMKSIGFDEVYHLKGGILKYLEVVPPEDSLWQGECFVFDDRVAVRQGGDKDDGNTIVKGSYHLCHACKQPLSGADRAHADFEQGVSCPHCAGKYTTAQRDRFRQRQRQMDLARARDTVHMGQSAQKPRTGK